MIDVKCLIIGLDTSTAGLDDSKNWQGIDVAEAFLVKIRQHLGRIRIAANESLTLWEHILI
jgi:hypothetical protein